VKTTTTEAVDTVMGNTADEAASVK